jgi:glycosyltransferase involved in cell wall biosynthesis
MFSQEERDLFSRTFGVTAERTEVVRFAHTLWSRADGPTSDGGYIFAGGDSLRDYETLLAAVDGLDVPVRIATNHDLGPLPANVTCGPVPYEEYVELIAGARLVVVPMRSTRRAAGLITYLDAMALGKPTIVTDSPAVGEYVEQGRTAMVVAPADPPAMRDAIAWVLDPGNAREVETMCGAARASVRHPIDYWQSLRDIAERAARRGARGATAA